MIDKVLIYEVHYSNFNRYVIPLAKYLLENGIAKEVIMIHDLFTKSDKIKETEHKSLFLKPANEVFKSLKNGGKEKIVFFNYSYRITDLYWTYNFRKLEARCYQMQHGMYAEFLERSFFGYFSSVKRKVTYLKYLFSFLWRGQGMIFLYLINKDFLKSFRLNDLIERKKDKIIPVHSNHVLVWGDYWKDWFVKNHFYKKSSNFTTVGNPDYHTFIKNKNNPYQPNRVCYIAQTFVEDGRMDKVDYKKIIDELSNAVKERLVIKLHPRSDKSIFETVLINNGEITYDFPITGFYVGHYSSLLALAANENSKVFLLEINNEEIPSYFKNSADEVFSEMSDLVTAIETANIDVNKKEISYYFENKEIHPFEIIGQEMLKKS